MIVASLLLLLQAPAAQEAPQAAAPDTGPTVEMGAQADGESEILVTGERYRKVKFKMKRDKKTGAGSCRITKTSGDKEFDTGICQSAVTCMGTEKILGEVWLACFEPTAEAMRQSLREKRQAARAATK